MTHDLIPLSEAERWTAALSEVSHGPAHTWGFCQAFQLTSQLPTYLYRYEREGARVVCPLSEREFAGRTDAVTPYGFGGFAGTSTAAFAADWSAYARERGWVTAYVALNPILYEPRGFPPDDVHVHNRLYVMDLSGSEDDVFRRMSQNRRRQLRDWRDVARAIRRDRAELTEFLLDNYAGFFASRRAGEATRFTPETMRAVAALDEVLLVGAGSHDAIEAVAGFAYTSHCADYLFNVSVPGGERHAAHLVWAAVIELRERGVPRLNMGGGISEGDQVAEFKRRFGGAELPLVSLRQVFRPDEYDALCQEAGVSASEPSEYFPAYRS